MSEKDFLDKHWKLFVEYISSLSPQDLEQQREDYMLLAAEYPKTFRSHAKFINGIYRRRKAPAAAIQTRPWVEQPESAVWRTGVRRSRQAGPGLGSAASGLDLNS
jgi:hypothetical protein